MCSKDLHAAIDIWSLDIAKHQCHVSQYQTLLSSAERKKAFRFRKEEDQLRSIISYGALRILLGQHLQIKPQEIQFEKNEFGKPYLKDHPTCQFNLSHSHTKILITMTQETPIGIDIEYMENKETMDKIAKRFFSEHEYQEYCTLIEEEKKQGFYNAWTRKEAFIKAIGTGRHFPLSDFDVSLSPQLPAKILSIRGSLKQENAASWNLYVQPNLEGYAMALCYKGPKRKIMNYKL